MGNAAILIPGVLVDSHIYAARPIALFRPLATSAARAESLHPDKAPGFTQRQVPHSNSAQHGETRASRRQPSIICGYARRAGEFSQGHFQTGTFISRPRYRAACRQSQLAPSQMCAYHHTAVTLALQRQNIASRSSADNGRKLIRCFAIRYHHEFTQQRHSAWSMRNAPQFCILARSSRSIKGSLGPGDNIR